MHEQLASSCTANMQSDADMTLFMSLALAVDMF